MVLYELDDFSQRLGAINLQIYTVTNDIRWYFSMEYRFIAVSLLLLHPIKDWRL